MAKLSFHGAAGCVTGSCMLLQTEAASILIDCGQFQGPKTLKALNYEPFPFDPRKIDALLLTHAHIDHSGLVPKLGLAGFTGPVLATPGTIDLCRVMLPDAGAIQEMEVEQLNRRNQRRGMAPVSPIYTRRDAEACLDLFQPLALSEWRDVARGVRVRMWNAGHILGAASIEVELTDGQEKQTALFSGDIGPGGSTFVEDPEGPSGVDHLVLESTYGDTDRPPLSAVARKEALLQEALAAHARGGPLLIPAFAVERTQELIVDLVDLMNENRAPPGPIFLDSPLAIRASKVFFRHGHDGDGVNRFANVHEHGWLHFTEGVNESRAIERMRGWHVIIAASGMCDAGRVRHHLKRLLWREQATVLLAGHQAIGTLGRLLQDGKRAVRIQGDDITVRAEIRALQAYSGHADAPGLERWAKARGPVRGGIFLTHGEPDSSEGLRRRLVSLGLADGHIMTPALDSTYALHRGEPPKTVGDLSQRIPQQAVAQLDWHNERAELMAQVQARLRDAASDEERSDLLRRLRDALRRR